MTGYNFLLLNVALVRWFAKALAAQQDARYVSRGQWREAMGLVEKYYVLNASFPTLFLYHPVLFETVRRIFSKSHYAHTMMISDI